MLDKPIDMSRMCRHCGGIDRPKLGQCAVCGMAVCDKCGNIQHTGGERRVLHDSCLREDDGGFKMIRFVK